MTEQPGQPGWSGSQYGRPDQGQYGQPGYQQPQYGQPQYGQPQYGPQPGYGQPVYAYPPSPPTNTMAIVALVLALTVAPGGLICGLLARKQIRETGEGGDGLALAGAIIGGVITGFYVLYFVIVIIGIIATVAATGA